MNKLISHTLFLLTLSLNLVQAAKMENSSPGAQALAPVNAGSRFQLLDTMPCLGSGLMGLTSATPLLRAGEFRQEDQTVITQVPQAQGKDAVWVQMNNYWIEPVTPPPSRGAPIIVPIDNVRVAEVQGEATLIDVVAPAPLTKAKTPKVKPVEVNSDMEIHNDATLCTAVSGSVAIMIGGHTSVRLVPGSKVQFHYDASIDTPRLEIKILQGALFCKIGRLPSGRVPDVAVRGPIGTMATIGSCDFFVQVDPVSLHVCLVRGKLLIGDAIPLAVGNMDWYTADADADGATGPQIRHWPGLASGEKKTRMDAQVLRFAIHQAQDLNVNIKALLASNSTPLSAEDQAYLAQIPRITWYEQATASP